MSNVMATPRKLGKLYDDDVSQQQAASSPPCSSTNVETAVLPGRGSLGAVASMIRVLRELDQLLTNDTLIYLAQAVVEISWASLRFAYTQHHQQSPRDSHRGGS